MYSKLWRSWRRVVLQVVAGVVQAEALAQAELDRLLHAAGVASVVQRAHRYLAPAQSADLEALASAEGEGADASAQGVAPTGAGEPLARVMAEDPELSADAVAAALTKLFVFASMADAVPEYERLSAPRLRVVVVRRVGEGLVAAYRGLYDALGDARHGYAADAVAAVRHTPAQVATLLGVQDTA
jgi:Conserved oligomeric complex COG6